MSRSRTAVDGGEARQRTAKKRTSSRRNEDGDMKFDITARRANESRSQNKEERGILGVRQRDVASHKAGAT